MSLDGGRDTFLLAHKSSGSASERRRGEGKRQRLGFWMGADSWAREAWPGEGPLVSVRPASGPPEEAWDVVFMALRPPAAIRPGRAVSRFSHISALLLGAGTEKKTRNLTK